MNDPQPPERSPAPPFDDRAIVLADAGGVIRYWSAGAETLFGYEPAAALGRTLDLIVPEEFRERHWAGFGSAMARGSPKLDQPAGVLPVLCQDGAVRRFPGRLIFLRDALGRSAGAMAVFVPNEEGPEQAKLPRL